MDLSESIELDVIETIKETNKAWKVKLADGVYWMPKSQCRIVGKKIYVPKWLAKSKGIDYLQIVKKRKIT